ncbi:hypothetical protein LJC17_04845 [Acholeplasma sp. OttesenSCG-928-E16]|nr:hypothetical protein [Acholeplasma sp. OttesenSCG-928-E16]
MAEKKDILNTLYKYKKVIFIIGFLLLALLFLVLLYTFRYNEFKDIYFTDSEDKVKLVYTKVDDLPVNLKYEYKQLDYNESYEKDKDLWFSKYYFSFSYSKKEATVSSVTVVVQLHSNWMDYRYLSSSASLSASGSSREVTVSTKRDIADWAFFPIKMKYPVMFIKISVDGTEYFIKDTKTIPQTKVPIFNV